MWKFGQYVANKFAKQRRSSWSGLTVLVAPGTRISPVQTIAKGLALAKQYGRRDVIVGTVARAPAAAAGNRVSHLLAGTVESERTPKSQNHHFDVK